jgi:hypothetical protein
VQVVDGEQQRALGGEVGGEPEQPVQRGERRDLLAAGVRRPEHRRRRRGGAGQRGRVGDALEQLAHDTEAELALQLAGTGGQHAQRARGAGARVGEQARLADPRRPGDHHDAPAPRSRLADRGVERRQLAVALEQSSAARSAKRTRKVRLA